MAAVASLPTTAWHGRSLQLDVVDLDFELANLLGPGLVRGEDAGGIEALPLGARDFVAGRVLLPLQPFELRDEPAPARLERRELFELRIRIETAAAKARANLLHVISRVHGVEHA